MACKRLYRIKVKVLKSSKVLKVLFLRFLKKGKYLLSINLMKKIVQRVNIMSVLFFDYISSEIRFT